MTDIEIANRVVPQNIVDVAKKLGLEEDNLILYGKHKAKIDIKTKDKKDSKLILVTAISPTRSGNGKTTVAIGLADALASKNKKVCLALREPSLGPVFGMKGGATGGGYSQVVPMADINLHFTGDFHAITSANNLLSSLIDNHIFQGNKLKIDEKQVLFRRCVDMNDRALRICTVAQARDLVQRKEQVVITAASEIMAIMCLATSLEDLKSRLGNIMVAKTFDGDPVYAKDLHAQDAMTILLKDALKPNLVQTLAGTPALVHMGPFANIAHGCCSIAATRTALNLSDYTVTEAGFGADLGAEKFIDLKCRQNNLKPNCVVLVATIKALKLNGGVGAKNLNTPNTDAVSRGIENLMQHLHAIKDIYHLPCVVTINKFDSDSNEEIELVKNVVEQAGVKCIENNVWAKGGDGAQELADAVLKLCEYKSKLGYAYDLSSPIKQKIFDIAHNVYGAAKVRYATEANKAIKLAEKLGYSNFPIVMAKTQYSFTDDSSILGAPKDFVLNVREVEIKSGAGFLVVILGEMMLMPGLGPSPAAVKMKIDKNGNISGLF